MQQLIGKLVERFEQGRIDRRQLIQSLTALAAAARPAVGDESTFRARSLNHIALRVTDIPRSRDFYRKHFGLPVVRENGGSCFLGLGEGNFLALFRNKAAGMDHYCIAIDNFDAGAVVDRLKKEQLEPDRPAGTDRVYFPDPDGLTVQVSSADLRA
jgi:catechol 2,3-dioxygenase-like lactoylglutathione lyase family enzyme